MPVTVTPEHIGKSIADQMKRSADRESWARRADLNDRLKAFTVPQLRAFLAAEGVHFTGNPKRAEVVGEVLDIFTPEDEHVCSEDCDPGNCEVQHESAFHIPE
jgi:hypothetical protein